jgi:hypothetical protein
MKQKFKQGNRRGQVMIITLILFVAVSAIIASGLVIPTVRNIKNSTDLFNSKKSFYLSDSALADSVYRVKTGLDYSETNLTPLDGTWATTTITNDLGSKIITTTGDYANYFRNLKSRLTAGEGVSFKYGVQVGVGGFVMANNSVVHGNVYSSGTISGGTVTGSAIVSGSTGLISGVNVGTLAEDQAWAHEVKDSTITGLLKCKVGSGNNKACDTSNPDPVDLPMPITDENIATWQADALLGGTTPGSVTISPSQDFGPKVVNGNLEVANGKTMTVKGTIWVKGNIVFKNNSVTVLSPEYGNRAGIIIADGKITVENGSTASSTGQIGSFILLLSTSDCPLGPVCTSGSAVTISQNANSIVVNAQKGQVNLANNMRVKAITAKKVVMSNGAEIIYDSGLINPEFYSGPGGGYTETFYKEIE